MIVPIYNVEKFLNKCLESIVSQSYRNLEIILVNDGSTDGSLSICQVFQEKDERIQIITQTNSGLSAARNTGIARATGEYLSFVDGDDYLHGDLYQYVIDKFQKYQCDLVSYCLVRVYRETPSYNNNPIMEGIITNEEMISKVFIGKEAYVSSCTKVYRRHLFEHVRFPIGRTSEDVFVILQILSQCQKVFFTTAPFYYYVIRENSITTSHFSLKNLDVLDAYYQNDQILRQDFPQLSFLGKFRLCFGYFYVLDRLLMSEQKDRELQQHLVNFLCQHCIIVFRGRFTFFRKIAMLCLMIHPCLYKLVLQMKNRRERQLLGDN